MTTILAAWLVFGLLSGLPAPGDDPATGKLGMSPAVVCSKIIGYDDYVPMMEPSLSRDEKLQVYYEPSGYDYETVGKEYRVHLVQDARVRRRGERRVLVAQDKIVDYQGTSKTPPLNVFLSNSISLKPLAPGDYELEIILRDEIGKRPPASQRLKFRVRAPEAEAETVEGAKPEEAPGARAGGRRDSPRP